ncbi:MAG: uracil-DNA glycosylase [bacterium]
MSPGDPEALEKLHRGVRRCRRCPLHEHRTRAVPGEGPANAWAMFVGEAPGAKEDVEGRPFVGRAGAFFDAALQDAGLRREDAYVTNSVKCRPPGNRDPRVGELEACRQAWLEKQIQLVDPALIVVMGNVAARELLGARDPLADLRGRLHEHQGRRCLVTYHPASAMRFPEAGRAWLSDFRKLERLRAREAKDT